MLNDTTALLVPISPENPAGDNLEYELLFDEIRQARESDVDYLPQDDWSPSEPRRADWNRVRTLSEHALTTQSKDLQLACWFTESLCHQEGLAGLLTGIEFLSEFITRFWFQCWPTLEDDGLLQRRSILLRLDRDLCQQLSSYPMLSQPITTLIYWRQVLAFEHKVSANTAAREDLIRREGDLTMATFNQQAAQFSSVDISQQASRVEKLSVVFSQLEKRYASLSLDPDGELFNLSRQTLQDLSDYLQRLTQRAIPVTCEDLTLIQAKDKNHTELFAETRQRPEPQAMNRELAISQMLAIAGYFRQTEPSSPVPFLMERAARWANMTLTEWLEEMLDDRSSINEINNVLTGQTH
ncbi:type VI secretion system protein TssA [Enterobacter asburiae]|nr:type VI secretion system protein TssA [Enterobacter asburiae]